MSEQTKVKKPLFKKKRTWFITAILFIGFIAAIGSTEEETFVDEAKDARETLEMLDEVDELNAQAELYTDTDIDGDGEVAEPVEEVKEEEPAPTPEPELSRSQENAIRKAESYISYSSFSRTGLIEQLEYEGFSNEESTFAVDYIKVDWKEQAVLKADSYLEYSSFSKSGLIEQLVYEGFTNDEATHGVNQAYN